MCRDSVAAHLERVGLALDSSQDAFRQSTLFEHEGGDACRRVGGRRLIPGGSQEASLLIAKACATQCASLRGLNYGRSWCPLASIDLCCPCLGLSLGSSRVRCAMQSLPCQLQRQG